MLHTVFFAAARLLTAASLAVGLFCPTGRTMRVSGATESISIPCGDNAALISAIHFANLTEEEETIHLAPGCVYTFTAGIEADSPGSNALPVIQKDLQLYGHGATLRRSTAIDTPTFRFLRTAAGAHLTIDHLTFENGGNVKLAEGGAIYSAGTLIITRSTFRDNTAISGGALFLKDNTEIGTSLFYGNTAEQNGGAIHAESSVWPGAIHLSITNSTFTGNRAASGFALNTFIETVLTHNTIANNSLFGTPQGLAAAVVKRSDQKLMLSNTLLQNTPYSDCDEPMDDQGGNLQSSNSCGAAIGNGDAELGELADNGGPTETMALPTDGLAGGIGVPANCLPTDQRGMARNPVYGCDAGAFERGGMVTGMITVQPDSVAVGEPALVTVFLANNTNVSLTSMAHWIPLPDGIMVTNIAAALNTCEANIVAVEGGQTVQFTNGSLAAGGNCTVTFYVNASKPGQFVLHSGHLFSPQIASTDLISEAGLIARGNTRLVYDPSFKQGLVNRPVLISARVETVPYLHNLPHGEVIYQISGPGLETPLQGKTPVNNGYVQFYAQGSQPGIYTISAFYTGSDWYNASPPAQILLKLSEPLFLPFVRR